MVCLLLLFVGLLIFFNRASLIDGQIRKEIERFEQKTGAKVNFDDLKVSGISVITLHDITLITPMRDTLFSAESVQLRLNPVSVLNGQKKPMRVNVEKSRLNIIYKQDYKNYRFLTSSDTLKKVSEGEIPVSHVDKATKLSKLYETFTRYSPRDLSLCEFNVNIMTDSMLVQYYFPETEIKRRTLYTQMVVSEKYLADTTYLLRNKYFGIEGKIGKKTSDRTSLKIYPLENKGEIFPTMQRRYGAKILFDTLNLALSAEKEEETILLKTDGEFVNTDIFHEKIAKTNIMCKDFAFSFNCRIKERSMEIDSSSTVTINKLKLHPYLLWEKEDEDSSATPSPSQTTVETVDRDTTLGTPKKITFNLYNNKIVAQDLFDAIPEGICSHLKGVEVEGQLAFNLHLKVNTHAIDELEFSSSLKPTNFKIIKFGATDFRKMAQPFLYHAYEKGVEVTQFVVGSENPDFMHLDQIPPYLTNSILYSEDGYFFYHKGFIEEATRASIIKNIKTKKFARGGSTISMQLVKNLWLSREKTLTRKFEEAMIVWFIENNRLLSKERMFEIYLNIIEWGPKIYGVRAASQFYFKKEPKDLTISEAIFMTSIIPRPKKFIWSFDEELHLKPYLSHYYNLITEKLLRHEIITPQDTVGMKPDVELKGAARNYFSGPVCLDYDETLEEDEPTDEEMKEYLEKP